MSLFKQLDEKDGLFQSVTQMRDSSPSTGSATAVNTGGVITFYSVDVADGGAGFSFNNGLFANESIPAPVSYTDISTVTALTNGNKYFSTVTNTHTLADGLVIGDTVTLSWLDGTIATITATSNITFTNKDNDTTSDVTWGFDFPVVEVVFIWNGSEWEIK